MPEQRTLVTHELKTWPEYFDAVLRGDKTFEIRKDDRPYAVGDTLHLREWSPSTEQYSGREARFRVTYALRNYHAMDQGYVVLGLAALLAQGEQRVDRPLVRYGVVWEGHDKQPTAPILVPMADGYWTPWHLAQGEAQQEHDGQGFGALRPPDRN